MTPLEVVDARLAVVDKNIETNKAASAALVVELDKLEYTRLEVMRIRGNIEALNP